MTIPPLSEPVSPEDLRLELRKKDELIAALREHARSLFDGNEAKLALLEKL